MSDNRRPCLAVFLGTRPEAIKLAPVIHEARQSGCFDTLVVSTGQHRDLLSGPLKLFDIQPDYNLEVMRDAQWPEAVLARVLLETAAVFNENVVDIVAVQGDTTTALGGALAGFHRKTPVVHVEAGLRSGHRHTPFPEEMNRRLIGQLASLHFAPTRRARENLVREGIDENDILVTGNTGIDALLATAADPRHCNPPADLTVPDEARLILVTTHRRENIGRPLNEICEAVLALASQRPRLHFVISRHPNPSFYRFITERMGGHDQIHLTEALPYEQFVAVMKRSYLLLTDSGGVQEEAPSLGKPVLVLRTDTERVEAIEAGTAQLVPLERDPIVRHVSELLDNPSHYARMANAVNPYGDGRAAQRIVRALAKAWREGLCAKSPPAEALVLVNS